MSDKESWNQYPTKAFYYEGVNKLEKELLEFMPGAKIDRLEKISLGVKKEYLIINNNLQIRHLKYSGSEKGYLSVDHRLVIRLNPNIKYPELIIKSLEERFTPKSLH
jgi:hypothetical protein